MKTLKHTLTAVALLISCYAAQAQNNTNEIVITGTRFTYPLFEKWISLYKKEHPDLHIRIASKGTKSADSANLFINAHRLTDNELPGLTTEAIARYALLPVANSQNKLLSIYGSRGIKSKELKKLFFEKYDPAEPDAEQKPNKQLKGYQPVFYTRAQKACAPITFAAYYGFEQENLVGNQLGGDDKHLIQAVLSDSAGVTYNVLSFIYDLNTRKVKEGLGIIPLDLNNNGKLDENEQIYGTIDQLITYLESTTNPGLPFEQVTLSYKKGQNNTKSIEEFISWIRSKGQLNNHEFGYALLSEKDLQTKLNPVSPAKTIAKQN
ncbi:hypothetical protein NF867_06705 [Solitalea sp. MAHUQ-68]|uniref:Uncharacterized protein n=1 Tax=Solitalea agri TaxID=2953739 RepID=A0A9X2F0P9_9SPHI|nr:hypothetical protein [Solitalea agri]MCO4292544.1 hypothetical protein [Solitalea agri]